jgi:hypothetical protein
MLRSLLWDYEVVVVCQAPLRWKGFDSISRTSPFISAPGFLPYEPLISAPCSLQALTSWSHLMLQLMHANSWP